MKVLTKTVLETSLLSIVRLIRVLRTSNLDIYMKLWMLLSEKISFFSFWNRFSFPRFEWLTILSNLTYQKLICSTVFQKSLLFNTSRAFPQMKSIVSPSISACPLYTRHSFLLSFLLLQPLSPSCFILSISFFHSQLMTSSNPSGEISSVFPGAYPDMACFSGEISVDMLLSLPLLSSIALFP